MLGFLNTAHYKFWGWLHQQSLARVQRYQLQNLTDDSFLERIELEYEEPRD